MTDLTTFQQQVWDDLFSDAGAVPSAHGAGPPAGNDAQSDLQRWFADADADHDGR